MDATNMATVFHDSGRCECVMVDKDKFKDVRKLAPRSKRKHFLAERKSRKHYSIFLKMKLEGNEI